MFFSLYLYSIKYYLLFIYFCINTTLIVNLIYYGLHLKLHQISTAQLWVVLKYVCLNSFEKNLKNRLNSFIIKESVQNRDCHCTAKSFYILSWERSFFHLLMKKIFKFFIANLLNNPTLNAHQSLSRPHAQKHSCPYPLSIKGFNAPCRSSQRT